MKNDYEKVPEEELIRRAKSGDEEAENVLLDHYKALVKKSARVLYLEGGDREDLLQEGMLGLFKAIKTFDFERGASFSTYAGQCVSNQMLSAVSSASRKKHAILTESVSLSEMDETGRDMSFLFTDGPEELVLEKEAEDQLMDRIEKALSPMEKKVLDLYLDGCSYKEIAARLDKSEKSIDNALQRIRAKVKEVKL